MVVERHERCCCGPESCLDLGAAFLALGIRESGGGCWAGCVPGPGTLLRWAWALGSKLLPWSLVAGRCRCWWWERLVQSVSLAKERFALVPPGRGRHGP